MNDKIRDAFGRIQAEEELKSKTRDYIYHKTRGYRGRRRVNDKRLVPALVCMLFLLLGGYGIYFTPTVEISIDINPSVELGVNRFDRIISLESYNEDGEALLDSLNLRFMNYSKAVDRIMEDEKILSLLSGDGVMTIAVVGTEPTESPQSEEILANIRTCAAGRKNTYCYYAHSEEVEEAHEAGLSYGKYRAFLELSALDPKVTVEEVQNMTMHEIRERIHSLSNASGREGYHEEQSDNHLRKHQGQGNTQGRKNQSQGNNHKRGGQGNEHGRRGQDRGKEYRRGR